MPEKQGRVLLVCVVLYKAVASPEITTRNQMLLSGDVSFFMLFHCCTSVLS